MINALKRFGRFLFILPLFLFAPYSSAVTPVYNAPRYAEAEVLVKFKDGADAVAALQAHRAAGGGVIRRYSVVKGLERVRLARGAAVADAVAAYMADPSVEYAEPNYIVRAAVTPNDPRFNQLWGLNNTGQVVNGIAGTAGADIKAPTAWDMQTGGTVVVASIDTGVDYSHADLSANMWINPAETPGNGIDDDGNGYVDDVYGINAITGSGDPMDDEGHGTHTSGTMAAVGNNGAGITGVNWTARIMALKFLDDTGSGLISDEVECIQYAINNGAKVINASYGFYGFSQSEKNAIQSAMNNGILFVAASGNDGIDNDNPPAGPPYNSIPNYPSSHTLANVIAVASTDQDDVLSVFSNYGATKVDLGAPGDNILSTYPVALDTTDGAADGYTFISGTSMAAPHVAGAAALIWAANPALTYAEVRDVILNNTDANVSLAGTTVTGGRLNLFNALSAVSAAPSGLTAAAVSTSRIDLSWTDNSTTETGFRIERKRGTGGVYSEITTVGADVTSYSDTGLAAGSRYFYRVRAYTATGNSAYSNVASATTLGGGDGDGGGGGGCFIATAAYGSYLAPEVIVLRDFRDRYLLTNRFGKAFVGLYYKNSPPIAQFIASNEISRVVARVMLTPLVYAVKYPLFALIAACIFVILTFKARKSKLS